MSAETAPLASCIMPTRDRPRFAQQACEYFLRQTYPSRELVVVADGAPLRGVIPDDPSIRLVEVPDRRSIGEKRNIAVAFAKGEVILHWDDDDWHGEDRIAVQVEPILSGLCDVSAFGCDVMLDADTMQYWTCAPPEHARLFEGDVHGGTLAYARRLWRDVARYPTVSLAEDAAFLRDIRRRGARLLRLPDAGQFIYVRHGTNAWDMPFGPPAWTRIAAPRLNATERRFYQELARRSSSRPVASPEVPMVSCIMPTADRHCFVGTAVDYFERQTYPKRELIVVDDGARAAATAFVERPDVRYLRIEPGLTLGEKRNLACQLARGTVIAHWDDDDWYGPSRLSCQVARLQESGASACGLSDVYFLATSPARGWRYSYAPSGRPWIAGATLCYWKDVWAKRPFEAVASGEDNRFVSGLQHRDVVGQANEACFVGIIHEGNSSPKQLSPPAWRPIPLRKIHSIMGVDLDRYLEPVSA